MLTDEVQTQFLWNKVHSREINLIYDITSFTCVYLDVYKTGDVEINSLILDLMRDQSAVE